MQHLVGKVLGCPWNVGKRQPINSDRSVDQIVHLKEETAKNEEEKSAASPRRCIVSQVDENDDKNTRIILRVALALPVFVPESLPLGMTKKISNEQVVVETEAYFAPKDKSYRKKYRKVREALE